MRSPHQHITLSCGQKCMPVSISIFSHNRTIFIIVVYHEVHTCICHCLALCIHHIEIDTSRRTIIVDEIDFRKSIRYKHFLLRSIIFAKHTGMHQHGTTGRTIEPSKVQHCFWFTSAHKPPLAISPCFYPRMVVVSMRPTGCINLSCGNTDSSQGRNGESGLLATSAVCCTDSSQW